MAQHPTDPQVEYSEGWVGPLSQFLADNDFNLSRAILIEGAIRAGQTYNGDEGAGGTWWLRPVGAAQ